MKTIWDAVNELKGEWKFRSDFICAATGSNVAYEKDDIYPSGSINVNSWFYHICTKEEFNALVTEMSLGLDVNPINDGYYHKYLDADKQELEPEPVIDWDSAPDGKNYALANKEKGLIEFFREKPVFVGDKSTPCWANHENEVFHLKANWELHERPTKQQSNTYTQEMSDNGELPPIGSLFIDVELSNDEQVEAMAHDLELGRVIYKRGSTLQDSEYFGAQAHECKPIPPKVDLINGKAYQFDFNSEKALGGIYSKHVFYCVDNDYSASACTNIKPLTVD